MFKKRFHRLHACPHQCPLCRSSCCTGKWEQLVNCGHRFFKEKAMSLLKGSQFPHLVRSCCHEARKLAAKTMLSNNTSKGILYLASSPNPWDSPKIMNGKVLAASLLAEKNKEMFSWKLETNQNPKRQFPNNVAHHHCGNPRHILPHRRNRSTASPSTKTSSDSCWSVSAARVMLLRKSMWLLCEEYFKALQSVPHFLHRKNHVGNCHNHKIMTPMKVHCTNFTHHKHIGIWHINSHIIKYIAKHQATHHLTGHTCRN